MTNALDDLVAALEEGETVEALVFGPWGWGSWNPPGNLEAPPRGKVMTLAEAAPFMQGWRIRGGYGSPECFAIYIWTDRRVLWVTQYDGSTRLDSAPRNPLACIPEMPGG
ncbi:MAG: hypothetical protein AAGE52_01610 [Myxococcota bacterium]